MSGMYFVLRCIGHKSLELRQGTTIKIGRDPSNDLVLNDPTVSSHHVVLQWDADQALPLLIVNSPAGVDMGDDLVEDQERAFITGGTTLCIGDMTVILQKKGVTKRKKPVTASHKNLREEAEAGGFRLFSEATTRLKGSFSAPGTLHNVLLSLEAEDRTGTLEITEPGGMRTKAIFGLGKLVTVQRGGAEGLGACAQMLALEAGEFLFTASIEPCEDSLNLSMKAHLETLS